MFPQLLIFDIFMKKNNFIMRFLRIHAVQSVINNPTQLSGRGFPRIFHMNLFLSQLYIFVGTSKWKPGRVIWKLKNILKFVMLNFEFVNIDVSGPLWAHFWLQIWKSKKSGTKSDRSAGVRCISSSMEVMELEAHLTSPTDRRATPRMIQHGQRCP